MQTTDRPLAEVLDDLAHGHDAAAGAIVAAASVASATTAAFAAAIAAMAARRSRQVWVDATGAVGQAEALRARLRALTTSDTQAYGQAHALLARAGRDRDHRGAPGVPGLRPRAASGERERELTAALLRAALPPLLVAEAAAEVADVARWIAQEGSADHRADAVAAVLLAVGATDAAAHLVAVNLALGPDDEPAVRARTAVVAAAAARAAVSGQTTAGG
jgi:formiminotetrahydrofolate cyclodeaminase